MKISIFWKIIAIFVPIILVTDLLILGITYNIIYDNNLHYSVDTLKRVSDQAEEFFSFFDLSKEENVNYCCEYSSALCSFFDLTYVYAIELDQEKNSEKYLIIGFGEDSTEEARETRYPGVVVTGCITDAEIAALNGDTENNNNVIHEKTKYGDSLIYYLPITKEYDPKTETVKVGKTNRIIGVELSITELMNSFQKNFRFIVFLTIIMTVSVFIGFIFVLRQKVTKPARQISSRMSSFVEDYSKGFKKLEVKGNDEFAEMARSFNTMADNIDNYLDSITKLNTEKQLHRAELDVAAKIQNGLLRQPHFQGEGFDIYACMHAAKEIGGDFYDYEVLDNGKLFIAIADVSGKGVYAALFMARAITLLSMYAKLGYSPAQALEEYNNTLAKQNPNGLFITTFAAVFDPATRELCYSNAGHNTPYVLSDELLPLNGAHGIAAGIFEGLTYEEETVVLKKGDCVFLYTDGVNEAKNESGALFTIETIEDILRSIDGKNRGSVIETVLGEVKDFIGNAEQSDDITMLAVLSE